MKDLISLFKTLRGENGCPWDQEQTPKSMAVYLIEEMYELVAAIESGSPEHICEELGDVLFHIVFIAGLFEEEGHFKIEDVTRRINEKMIRRHPHVFKEHPVNTLDDIRENWHRIKMREKNHSAQESVLDSVPVNLPALMRAYRISERAARTGFDWENISQVMKKAEEEWSELEYEVRKKKESHKSQKVTMEFGDVLFTLTNVARFAKIHPETALSSAITKFEKRFRYMEMKAGEAGKTLESISRDEFDEMWEEAKRNIPEIKPERGYDDRDSGL